MSNELEKYNFLPMEKIDTLSLSMTNSGGFGFKNKDLTFCHLMACDAMGVHPALFHLKYHLMQDGRVAKKDTAVLSDFLESGGKVEFTVYSDSECEGVFSHPRGATIPPIKWTLETAKKAGLLEKQGTPWHKYPRAMLKARVITEGIRLCYPQALNGMLSQSEMEDSQREKEVKGNHKIKKPKFNLKKENDGQADDDSFIEIQEDLKTPKIQRIKEICSKLEGAQEWLNKVLENNGGKSLQETDEMAVNKLLSRLEQRLLESEKCVQ